MALIEIHPPTVVRSLAGAGGFFSSWTGGEGPLNDEHARIAASVGAGVEGGGESDDAAVIEKLYEMGFYNGAVILEVRMGSGARAVAALRGARAAVAFSPMGRWPEYFGVTPDAESLVRAERAMREGGVEEHGLVFFGELARFSASIPIVPTMVVLTVGAADGYAETWGWLRQLSSLLAQGTPVLVNRASQPGAARALREWIETQCYTAMGRFGDAMLLVATDGCGGSPRGLAVEMFGEVRNGLLRAYQEGNAPVSAGARDVVEATAPARTAFLGDSLMSPLYGKRGWPFEKPELGEMPDSLPDGTPWPKISIVTPSYNYGQFIEETLLSVLHQGYPHVEHIVMDGGSTDGTAEVFERYRSRLAYAVSEKDKGQSNAINKGFARATGDIFTWINADDMLAPGALRAMALAFWHSKADVVAGICEQYRDGRLIEKHMTCCENGPMPVEEMLDIEGSWMMGQFFMQPEVMFTREIWERAGGHVKEDLFYSMDYEMWLRFAVAGAKLHVIGRPICRFRHHGEQKTALAERFIPELNRVRDGFAKEHGITPANQRVAGAPRHALRIASISDLGFKLGAGIGQKRIMTALAAAGHEIFSYSATDQGMSRENADVQQIVETVGLASPDVVLVGNVHGARLPSGIIDACARRWTTGVVLHDLWAMTGRCAYTGGCEKYLSGCDETCPTAEEYPALPRPEIFPAWQAKYSLYESERAPLLLANSEWTAEFARRGLRARLGNSKDATTGSQVFTIRYGVETEIFQPMPREFCRRQLSLPQDRFLILASASSLEDPRKGIHLLVEAVRKLAIPDITVVCLGRPDDALEAALPGLRALGYIREPERLAMVYSAVDLFVGASCEEAFGQVFTEAAACGVPSVGFPVGGIPEAIADGVSGLVAAQANAEELAVAIYRLYSEPKRRRAMGVWGRLFAENEWSPAMAYHGVHVALRKSGAAARLNFPPKIRFVPHPPSLPAPVNLALQTGAWQPISGFKPWEGPHPDMGLPRCRWLVGPVSRFRIDAAQQGPHLLTITVTTFQPNTVLRVVQDGILIADVGVPVFQKGSVGHTFSCHLNLEAASSPIELLHWPWGINDSVHGLSVLMFDLKITDATNVSLPIVEVTNVEDRPSFRK